MFAPLGIQELLLITVIGSIWVAALAWIARDARERGMNPAVWVPVVLILNLLGLVAYFAARPEKRAGR